MRRDLGSSRLGSCFRRFRMHHTLCQLPLTSFATCAGNASRVPIQLQQLVLHNTQVPIGTVIADIFSVALKGYAAVEETGASSAAAKT